METIQQNSKQVEQSFVKLRRLQAEHRQLQQSLNQRKQSLLLHSKMLAQIEDNELNKKNTQLLNELFKKQEEIQTAYANMLINGQIRIQQQIQYRDLLKQYQCRIMQLRTTMIDKQAQLVAQMQTKRRQYVPTKDHLRQFNLAQMEQANIKKLLRQHGNLEKQVKSLEQQYRIRSQRTRDRSETEEQEIPISQKTKKINPVTSKIKNLPQGAIFRDRLLHRVYSLLQEQIQMELNLKEQYQKLFSQYQNLTVKHKKMADIYQESHINYSQKILNQLDNVDEVQEEQVDNAGQKDFKTASNSNTRQSFKQSTTSKGFYKKTSPEDQKLSQEYQI